MSDAFTVRDTVTVAIASIGAVLGIINTWKGYDKDRPKLKIMPKQAIPVGIGDTRRRLCIDVTNLSSFSLTVVEVGVFYHGTNERGASVRPIIIDGGDFPRKLEPRTSFTPYFSPDAFEGCKHQIKCAYVKTDCGLTFTGNSPALKQLAKYYASNDRLPE